LVAEVNGTPFFVPAPKVMVRDATGSGDVVTAALIYGEILCWPMERNLKKAVLEAALHAKVTT